MVVLIGGKEHKKGTSKAGNAYDFNVLHFLAPKKNVYGLAAYEKIVDPTVISYDDILVNQHYEIETDMEGNITAMMAAKS